MIIILKKSNIVLLGLVFLLLLTIFSLNYGTEDMKAVMNSIAKKTIILDPGHGGEDPGAVSDYSGIKEKDINLKIALFTKELLEKDGYKVIMTREDDRLVYREGTTNIIDKRKQDLTRRKEIMDNSGADLVVSIHLNKFPEKKYFGAQTFYPPGSPESQRLAQTIQKSIREKVDPENKRESLVKEDPIIILRDLKTTTAIVECGFLSNREEESKLATEEYQRKLAEAIKDGIVEYLEK